MDVLREDIVRIRKELGWSQQKLAEHLFVSQNTISQYETGSRSLTTEMFLYILSSMNVSFSYQFKNEKGDDIIMKTKKAEHIAEPIDFRAIRSEEGFRLWALQNDSESLTIDINDEHFIVYKKGNDGALFWLYLDDFNRDILIQICKEEDISYEEI